MGLQSQTQMNEHAHTIIKQGKNTEKITPKELDIPRLTESLECASQQLGIHHRVEIRSWEDGTLNLVGRGKEREELGNSHQRLQCVFHINKIKVHSICLNYSKTHTHMVILNRCVNCMSVAVT